MDTNGTVKNETSSNNVGSSSGVENGGNIVRANAAEEQRMGIARTTSTTPATPTESNVVDKDSCLAEKKLIAGRSAAHREHVQQRQQTQKVDNRSGGVREGQETDPSTASASSLSSSSSLRARSAREHVEAFRNKGRSTNDGKDNDIPPESETTNPPTTTTTTTLSTTKTGHSTAERVTVIGYGAPPREDDLPDGDSSNFDHDDKNNVEDTVDVERGDGANNEVVDTNDNQAKQTFTDSTDQERLLQELYNATMSNLVMATEVVTIDDDDENQITNREEIAKDREELERLRGILQNTVRAEAVQVVDIDNTNNSDDHNSNRSLYKLKRSEQRWWTCSSRAFMTALCVIGFIVVALIVVVFVLVHDTSSSTASSTDPGTGQNTTKNETKTDPPAVVQRSPVCLIPPSPLACDNVPPMLDTKKSNCTTLTTQLVWKYTGHWCRQDSVDNTVIHGSGSGGTVQLSSSTSNPRALSYQCLDFDWDRENSDGTTTLNMLSHPDRVWLIVSDLSYQHVSFRGWVEQTTDHFAGPATKIVVPLNTPDVSTHHVLRIYQDEWDESDDTNNSNSTNLPLQVVHFESWSCSDGALRIGEEYGAFQLLNYSVENDIDWDAILLGENSESNVGGPAPLSTATVEFATRLFSMTKGMEYEMKPQTAILTSDEASSDGAIPFYPLQVYAVTDDPRIRGDKTARSFRTRPLKLDVTRPQDYTLHQSYQVILLSQDDLKCQSFVGETFFIGNPEIHFVPDNNEDEEKGQGTNVTGPSREDGDEDEEDGDGLVDFPAGGTETPAPTHPCALYWETPYAELSCRATQVCGLVDLYDVRDWILRVPVRLPPLSDGSKKPEKTDDGAEKTDDGSTVATTEGQVGMEDDGATTTSTGSTGATTEGQVGKEVDGATTTGNEGVVGITGSPGN